MKADPKTDPRIAAHKAKSMGAATVEAHDRESRVEAATKRQESERKTAELPPDDGVGGTWQPPKSES